MEDYQIMSNRRYYETPKSWFAFREEQMKTFYRRNPVPKRDPDTDYDAYTAVLERWMDKLPDSEKQMDDFSIYPKYELEDEVKTWMTRFTKPEAQAELEEAHPGRFTGYLESTRKREGDKSYFALTEDAMDKVAQANDEKLNEPVVKRPNKRR